METFPFECVKCSGKKCSKSSIVAGDNPWEYVVCKIYELVINDKSDTTEISRLQYIYKELENDIITGTYTGFGYVISNYTDKSKQVHTLTLYDGHDYSKEKNYFLAHMWCCNCYDWP